MLQAGQDRATRPLRKVIGDLDDRRNRFVRLAEKFEAHSAHARRHLVHDPARRRDQPIAAFFLHARYATEKFIGDVLAETHLAKLCAGNRQAARCATPSPCPRTVAPSLYRQLEHRFARVVNLAEVVTDALDFEPVALRDRPCATTRGCRPPCPTAPPSCRRRSSRCCRRRTMHRPTSDRLRTHSRHAQPLRRPCASRRPRPTGPWAPAHRRRAVQPISTSDKVLKLLGVDHRRHAASAESHRRCSPSRRRAE